MVTRLDRSELWSPAVRKWMTDWHTPVAGMWDKPRTFRGSGKPNVSITPAQLPFLNFSNPYVTIPAYSNSQYEGILGF